MSDDLRKAFDLFDLNHDGVLSSSELKVVLISFGYHVTDQELADIVTELDANHNGVIDYPEFLRLVETHPPKPGAEKTLDDVMLAFAAFDRDGNGKISAAELKASMEVMGLALTDAEVEEAIKEADVDGDGMINYSEFARMMKLS
jgi:calmodulin